MKINDYILKIKKLRACEKAVANAHNYKTSQELWLDCKRGDWMLWLIGKLSGESGSEKRRQLVLTTCKCARLALPYAGKNKEVTLKAIETAEQWARGENNITLEDVQKAAAAAYAADAADAAAAYASSYAAYAAYASSYAAAYAAYAAAASDAAYAAAYAAYASSYAAAYAARKEILKKCADIVRADYPNVDDLW